MNIFRSRVAAVAAGALVLVSIGGVSGAVAASKITSADIKNQTIQSHDIDTNGVGKSEIRLEAVGSGEIRNDTIKQRDLRPHVRELLHRTSSGEKGTRGEKGEKGDRGKKGDKGEPGEDSILDIYTAKPTAALKTVDAGGGRVSTTATCDDGYVAVGGGFTVKDESGGGSRSDAAVTKSGFGGIYDADSQMFDGWEVRVSNTADSGSFNIYPYVVCAELN